MVINLDGAKVIEFCSCGISRVVSDGVTGTEIRVHKECEGHHECPACESGLASKANHAGSPFCENGSIASGGRYIHCQCDTCSTL